MSGIIIFLLVVLVSVQAHAAARPGTALQQQCHVTVERLRSLDTPCAQDLVAHVQAEQKRLPGRVLYCSLSSIVIDLAEILVDSAFFGFEAYEELPALWNDIKDLRKCLSETSAEAMVTCALEYLPGGLQAGEVVVGGLENYLGEMQMILPLLVSEIEDCRESSEQHLRSILETALDQAVTCPGSS